MVVVCKYTHQILLNRVYHKVCLCWKPKEYGEIRVIIIITDETFIEYKLYSFSILLLWPSPRVDEVSFCRISSQRAIPMKFHLQCICCINYLYCCCIVSYRAFSSGFKQYRQETIYRMNKRRIHIQYKLILKIRHAWTFYPGMGHVHSVLMFDLSSFSKFNSTRRIYCTVQKNGDQIYHSSSN